MNQLTNLSCVEFARILAAKEPVPGGGGASAMVGALAAALGEMSGHYTLGKKKFLEFDSEIRENMAECARIRERLLALIDEDAQAFEPLSKAYAIPKDDPTKTAVMEECLKNAAQGPAEMARLCAETIKLFAGMVEGKTSKMIISDAGTGVVFAQAALRGAVLNVKVNTASMADKAYAKALNAEMDSLLEECSALADQTYIKVVKKFPVKEV